MTAFTYFADPHGSAVSTWTDEPRRCDICGATRPGYDGPFYGEGDEVEFVCEPCLVAGRLRERRLSTNEGVATIDPRPTDELEHRTPHLVTWQDMSWPTHCDDYCRFEREVGQRELEELGGADFFKAHLHEDLADAELEWEDVPPRAPTNRRVSNSPSVYLLRCWQFRTPVLWWDVD